MQYRKKPVVIDAIQWQGLAHSTIKIENFVGKELEIVGPPGEGKLIIPTLEGNMEASIGDFIIRGIQGEFYPCKEDIFYATYEKV